MIRRYIIWRNDQATTIGYAESSAGQTLPDAALAHIPRKHRIRPGDNHSPVAN
jgi:hypothetical protein